MSPGQRILSVNYRVSRKKVPLRFWLISQRNHSILWEKISYIETLKKVKSIAYFLLNHRLSAKRPLLILSGNDINHALVALACLYSKIPYSSISPAYSLFEDDLDRIIPELSRELGLNIEKNYFLQKKIKFFLKRNSNLHEKIGILNFFKFLIKK